MCKHRSKLNVGHKQNHKNMINMIEYPFNSIIYI